MNGKKLTEKMVLDQCIEQAFPDLVMLALEEDDALQNELSTNKKIRKLITGWAYKHPEVVLDEIGYYIANLDDLEDDDIW